MYSITLACVILFAIVGSIVSWLKGCRLELNHVITQGGSGATFPVFVLMPIVPFDDHLMEIMSQSWVTVGMAGLLGAGVLLNALFRPPTHSNGSDASV